jgi:hypothetical protein
MIDTRLLDIALMVIWMLLSVTLVVFSSGAAGRKLADIDVMRLRGVNGVRAIAARVQLRTQINRIALGIAFGLLGLLVIAAVDPIVVRYVARVGLVGILTMFAVSSVIDWRDDREQLRLVINEYAREHPNEQIGGKEEE